jgi:hypothetical protein
MYTCTQILIQTINIVFGLSCLILFDDKIILILDFLRIDRYQGIPCRRPMGNFIHLGCIIPVSFEYVVNWDLFEVSNLKCRKPDMAWNSNFCPWVNLFNLGVESRMIPWNVRAQRKAPLTTHPSPIELLHRGYI